MLMIAQAKTIKTLIVDDSEDVCLWLDLELHHIASIKVIGFVHDGVEALAYLTGTEQFKDRELFPYPDLMLLDYRMPRCDGMKVLAHLQHQFHRPEIVLWSDTIEQIDMSMALRLGANLVSRKPASRKELIELMGRLERVFDRSPMLDDAQIAGVLMTT